jgi:hypothetical protein
MKTKLYILLIVISILGFKNAIENVSENWTSQSFLILNEISTNQINIEEKKIFENIISSRTTKTFLKIDSLNNLGFDLIYIIEEFDSKTKSFLKIEKFYSSSNPKFYVFYSIEKNRKDSIIIPNFKFINDTLQKYFKSSDPFYIDEKKCVISYWDTLTIINYTVPVIERTFVTPGCTGTLFAVEAEEKRLKLKNKNPILSSKYRIETLIKQKTINMSFQIPKLMQPVIHINATTF